MPFPIPTEWLPDAAITGVNVHWTAGQNKASDFDRAHYHILINGDGSLVRGIPTIDKNDARGCKTGYAAHTLNCNTGRIGVSLAGMAGATESPFNAGKQPITREQWETLGAVLAQLCKRYGIVVSPKTVLSHAEVQRTLGITQRNKWDIARLPFDPSLKDAYAIGDDFRRRAVEQMTKGGVPHYTPQAGSYVNTPVARATIRRGDVGGDVQAWQAFLLKSGYDLGKWKDDGQFGEATDVATRAYQTTHNLTVDGVVGGATWKSAGA